MPSLAYLYLILNEMRISGKIVQVNKKAFKYYLYLFALNKQVQNYLFVKLNKCSFKKKTCWNKIVHYDNVRRNPFNYNKGYCNFSKIRHNLHCKKLSEYTSVIQIN